MVKFSTVQMFVHFPNLDFSLGTRLMSFGLVWFRVARRDRLESNDFPD